MDSQRQIRFGELIRSLISDCLLKEDFYDQSINLTSITVSFVKMSKDLKIANDMAKKVSLESNMAKKALDLYKRFCKKNGSELDYSAIIKLLSDSKK